MKSTEDAKSIMVDIGDDNTTVNSALISFNLDSYAFDYVENINNFVIRLYTEFLGRTPDKTGLHNNSEALKNATKTIYDIVGGFFLSQEYKNKYTSNEDFVDSLYNGLLNSQS